MRLGSVVILTLVTFSSLPMGQSIGIGRVAWLQGCWEMVSPGRVVEEQWMAPRGTSMLGVGRTVRGETLIDYELVVLREQGDRLAYEAYPRGQPAAVFVSKAMSDSSVLFENLKHDFPQRIGYERQGSTLLLAWIEGTQNGQFRRLDFPYRRAVCAGS